MKCYWFGDETNDPVMCHECLKLANEVWDKTGSPVACANALKERRHGKAKGLSGEEVSEVR